MLPSISTKTHLQNTVERIKSLQKSFRTIVMDNPRFKWYQRGVWLVSLTWAAFLAIQSIPFYTAIGQGESFYKQGIYATAEQKFNDALSESRKFGPADLRRAKVLNNLAELYRTEGKYAKAESFLNQAVAIAQKLGNKRPEYPMSLNNLANLYREEGIYTQAEETFTKAILFWDTNIKKNDVNHAALLNGLGKLKRDQGEYATAEKLYQESLAT